MTDGRQVHAINVERCAKDGMVVYLVAIDDQPWFALDSEALGGSCTVLAAEVESKVPEKDRSHREVTWPDGEKRPTSLLNELGLYRVLLTSESPVAADLARWVFEEVVPKVRKSGRYRLFQEAQRLGVHLDYTDDQWEWLKLHPYLIDVIPLALAGFDSIQITQTLGYNTSSGITVRKQLAKLRRLGFLPARIVPRVKQLEARIAAQPRN